MGFVVCLMLPALGQEGDRESGPAGTSMREGGGQGPHSGRERNEPVHLDRKYNDKGLEKLGVNEETRKKIRALIHDFQKDQLEVDFQKSEAQTLVRSAFASDLLSEASVSAAIDQLGELTKREVVTALKSELAIAVLLTPKQRKDLQQMKGEMMKQKEMAKKN